MRRLYTRTLALALALSALGTTTSADAKVLKVVASFTILADMARNVGGDKVEVVSLVGPNGDPHTFEPTPTDARTLRDADVVLVNGLGLEGWMDRLIAASGYRGKPVVVSQGIAPLRNKEHGRAAFDPHAWNDAANGVVYVKSIAMALVAADPDDATAFKGNAEAYEAKLAELDREARVDIARIPSGRRKILTTHDALGYFAKAYGVEILAPLGVSTDEQPSAKAMAALIGQIGRERIKTYFLQNSNDPRLIAQIARATGAKPGGALYVESLSKPDGPAGTYLAMFRHNLDLIVEAMRRQVDATAR